MRPPPWVTQTIVGELAKFWLLGMMISLGLAAGEISPDGLDVGPIVGSGQGPPNKHLLQEIALAVASGESTALKTLLALHPHQINAMDDNDNTPLLLAARNNRSICALYLLSLGAAVNVSDNPFETDQIPVETGNTPLHWAAAHSDELLVALLLLHGADVETLNRGGQTPLHVAIKSRSYAVAERLLAAGSRMDTPDTWGNTPFAYALIETDEPSPERLALIYKMDAAGARAGEVYFYCRGEIPIPRTEQYYYGFTPLPRSALLNCVGLNGNTPVIELLLNRGTKPDNTTAYDTAAQPLSIALAGSRLDVANLLLDRGAQVQIRDSWDRSPLELAAATGDLDIIKRLVSRGCQVEERSRTGYTAMQYTSNYSVATWLAERFDGDLYPEFVQAAEAHRWETVAACYPYVTPVPSVAWHGLWVAALNLFMLRTLQKLRAAQRPETDAVADCEAGVAPWTSAARVPHWEFWSSRAVLGVVLLDWVLIWVLFFVDPYLRLQPMAGNLVTGGFVACWAGVLAHLHSGINRGRWLTCLFGLALAVGSAWWSLFCAQTFENLRAAGLVALFYSNAGLMVGMGILLAHLGWKSWQLAELHSQQRAAAAAAVDSPLDFEVGCGWDEEAESISL